MTDHLVPENQETKPVRVFISYSHDDEAHKERVLALAHRLRREGVDAQIDRFYEVPPPAHGWPDWMVKQVRDSDFVLVVCTEIYARRFLHEDEDRGKGVQWEGALITQQLYDAAARNTKFFPVGFVSYGDNEAHIPLPLRPTTYYNVADESGYTLLYRTLTGQPENALVPLGPLRQFPAREDVSAAAEPPAPPRVESFPDRNPRYIISPTEIDRDGEERRETMRSPVLTGGATRSVFAPIPPEELEYIGTAVPVTSRFYVARKTDDAFYAALRLKPGVIALHGANQMGKSSLINRGIQRVRDAGARVVVTDFNVLDRNDFDTLEDLLPALLTNLAFELELETFPKKTWNADLAAGDNARRYIRQNILNVANSPFVWVMDEIDVLVGCDYCAQLFGLFRAWFNRRSTFPNENWQNFSIIMAHVQPGGAFVPHDNQSPFNIAERFVLSEFTDSEIVELSLIYGLPLLDDAQRQRFIAKAGRRPNAVRYAFNRMIQSKLDISALEKEDFPH